MFLGSAGCFSWLISDLSPNMVVSTALFPTLLSTALRSSGLVTRTSLRFLLLLSFPPLGIYAYSLSTSPFTSLPMHKASFPVPGLSCPVHLCPDHLPLHCFLGARSFLLPRIPRCKLRCRRSYRRTLAESPRLEVTDTCR